VTRAGTDAIEAIFQFETAEGRGKEYCDLRPDEKNTLRAWTLFTALDEIKGFEEQVGRLRSRVSPIRATFRALTGSTSGNLPPRMSRGIPLCWS